MNLVTILLEKFVVSKPRSFLWALGLFYFLNMIEKGQNGK